MGRARDIRLLSDYQKINEFAEKFPFLTITRVEGMPPVEYHLLFRLKGYLNASGLIATEHTVKLLFPEQYPFSAPPKFAFTEGLFHPNVYKNGDVCHGWYLNNWHPGIHIDDLLMDITKMICFKPDSYNLKSPANYACDADWIAAHSIPADDIKLEEEKKKNHEAALPATPHQLTGTDTNVLQDVESTTDIKVKIKSIRNVLTFAEFADKITEQKDRVNVQFNHNK